MDILHLSTFNPLHQPSTCYILGTRSSAMTCLAGRWRRSSTKDHIRNTSPLMKKSLRGSKRVGRGWWVQQGKFIRMTHERSPGRAFDRGIYSTVVAFGLCLRSLILKLRRHQNFTNPRSNTSDMMMAIMENVKMTR